jgi:hypothetical protein
MTTLVKPLIAAGAVAGSVIGAYKGFERWYESEREARLQEGALSESTLPYYDHVLELAKQHGLVITAAGGIVKQALIDPSTEYDTDNRLFTVSENPNCYARSKATLYRTRPELTLRDMDWRVRSLLVHHGTEDIWAPALSGQTTRIRHRQARMQRQLDAFAQSRGFKRGPELSLFPYEDDFDVGGFRITDYVTRTRLLRGETDHALELLFDNNGNQTLVPVQDGWTCVVAYERGELRIPTDAPVTLLGRTLTRAVVNRKRDLTEVQRAYETIMKNNPEVIPQDLWQIYLAFRTALDNSLGQETRKKLLRNRNYTALAHLGLARLLLPAKDWIEDSPIGMAIRDPELEVFSNFFASKVGAK